MGWFNRNRRKPDDVAAELIEAMSDPNTPAQFSWVIVAAWAFKLLMLLLFKYPALMSKVLDVQQRIAEAMDGSDRDLALQANSANRRLYEANRDLVAAVLRNERS